jgi:hypothetical protein
MAIMLPANTYLTGNEVVVAEIFYVWERKKRRVFICHCEEC